MQWVILIVFSNTLGFIKADLKILGVKFICENAGQFGDDHENSGTKDRALYSTLILSINEFLKLFNPAYYYLAKDFMQLMSATIALEGMLLLFSLYILSESPLYLTQIGISRKLAVHWITSQCSTRKLHLTPIKNSKKERSDMLMWSITKNKT